MSEITELQKRTLSEFLGTNLVVSGINSLRNSYNNLGYEVKPVCFANISITSILNIPSISKDYDAYFTSWENWEKMLDTIWGVIKNFPWERERADCDDRARVVSGLCSLIYRINTCGQMYCEFTNILTGEKGRHYANIIMDNNQNLYLFDVDNGGLKMKLEKNKPTTMGNWSYRFISMELA
jgi:hypothetical protein